MLLGDSAFEGCTALKSISLPENLKDQHSIGGSVFKGCTGLSEIKLPDSMTGLPYSIFSGCTALARISFPPSLQTIEAYAFEGCTSLGCISLPDNVTYIGHRAFADCRNLVSVLLPLRLEEIRGNAFHYCDYLLYIYSPSPIPVVTDVDDYVFDARAYSQATLFVTQEALESYRQTQPWSMFEKIETFVPSATEISTIALSPSTWRCEAGELIPHRS